MATKTYTVSKQFVLEAHKEACSEWKEKIEKKFPELFKSKYFKFDESVTISRSSGGCSLPIYLGWGHADEDLKGHCLIVADGWNFETRKTSDGRTQIAFVKK